MKEMNDVLLYIVAVLAGLDVILILLVIWYHMRLARWQGVSKVVSVLEGITDLVDDLQERLDRVEVALRRMPSDWSVIRYDASPEVAGRQSSTLAVVNGEGDGWVLTSVTFDSSSAVYVKEIRRWKAVEPFVLTTEEEIALEKIAEERRHKGKE